MLNPTQKKHLEHTGLEKAAIAQFSKCKSTASCALSEEDANQLHDAIENNIYGKGTAKLSLIVNVQNSVERS
jgi:hypothetical protein